MAIEFKNDETHGVQNYSPWVFFFVSVILSLVHEVAKTNNKGDIENPKPIVKEKFKHDITFVMWLIGTFIYRLSFSSFSSNIAEKLSVYSFTMSNEPMIS